MGHAADWLRLAGVQRVPDYAIFGEQDAGLAFAKRLGYREPFRARRGWGRAVSRAT